MTGSTTSGFDCCSSCAGGQVHRRRHAAAAPDAGRRADGTDARAARRTRRRADARGDRDRAGRLDARVQPLRPLHRQAPFDAARSSAAVAVGDLARRRELGRRLDRCERAAGVCERRAAISYVEVSKAGGPSATRVLRSVPDGHRIDELDVARRGSSATAAWAESWYDARGDFHSQIRVADLGSHPSARSLSAVDGQASGTQFCRQRGRRAGRRLGDLHKLRGMQRPGRNARRQGPVRLPGRAR